MGAKLLEQRYESKLRFGRAPARARRTRHRALGGGTRARAFRRGGGGPPIAVATCDLDVGVLQGAYPLPGPYPFGHEGVAEVDVVGDEVGTVRPGDRVVVPFQISCGGCASVHARPYRQLARHRRLSTYGLGSMGGLEWGGLLADLAAPCRTPTPCSCRSPGASRPWWPAPATTSPTGGGLSGRLSSSSPARTCSWSAATGDPTRSASTRPASVGAGAAGRLRRSRGRHRPVAAFGAESSRIDPPQGWRLSDHRRRRWRRGRPPLRARQHGI